jgi:hypothetical protein
MASTPRWTSYPTGDRSPPHAKHCAAGTCSTSSAWPAPIRSAPTACSPTPRWWSSCWDNTARRRNGGATILHGSTPEAYCHWLRSVLADQETLGQLPVPIVFINAWQKWAERNHLESIYLLSLDYFTATVDMLMTKTMAKH